MTNVTAIHPGVLPDIPVTNESEAARRLLQDLRNYAPVDDGTIIKWTSVHPVNGVEFKYAAVFAGGAWYTTVVRDNPNVQKIMQHDEMVHYLNSKKQNLRDIAVAIDFATLNW